MLQLQLNEPWTDRVKTLALAAGFEHRYNRAGYHVLSAKLLEDPSAQIPVDELVEAAVTTARALLENIGSPMRKQLPPLLRRAAAIERADIAKLQALAEPASEREHGPIEKLVVASYDKARDEMSLANALATGELSAISEAEETTKAAKARAHGLAQGYGIECGEHE